jgi:hypothetical protein
VQGQSRQTTKSKAYTKPFVFTFRIFLRTIGTDLGEEVGAEEPDGEDDHDEGDDEVNKGGNNGADLEGGTANRHLRLRDSLAGREGGGKDRGDQTLGEGREKLGDDAAKVDRRRDDDDILGVEHLFVYGVGEKTTRL